MGQKVYVVEGNLYNPDDDNEYKTYCAALYEEQEAESYWTHTVSKLVKGKNVKHQSFKNLAEAYDYIKTNYPEKYDENNAAQNMKESHENEIEELSPRIVIDARKNLEEILDFCVTLFYEFDFDTTNYSIENNTYSGKSVFNYRSLPCVLLYIRNYGFGYIAQYTEVYKMMYEYLEGKTPSILSIGFGAGFDYYSALKEYSGDKSFNYTGCDINKWSVYIKDFEGKVNDQWFISDNYVDELKNDSVKKNILFFPRVLSEINPEEPVTQNLMENIIDNIQLEDEGYVCVYTRKERKSKKINNLNKPSEKDEWERGNIENIVSAIKEKGFNVSILSKDKTTFVELEDDNDIEAYMIPSIKYDRLDELFQNAYADIKEKDDNLKEEYRNLYNMDEDSRKNFMQRNIVKNIEQHGQYYIIRWQK